MADAFAPCRRVWLSRAAGIGIGAGIVALPAGLSLAHTPYGQWKAYRQKHLTIGCHRDDPDTYRLAQAIVAELEAELPEASARVARGPTAGRLASLLGTDQMQAAILSTTDAVAMSAGSEGFEAYGRIPLRQVVRLDESHVLVAVADMPDRHARLIASALADSGLELDVARSPPAGLERHPGVEMSP